jgi:hypothetical protein
MAIRLKRANPVKLREFDISKKTCWMNCGSHRDDPRSEKERRFLCEDCLISKTHNAHYAPK